MEKEKKVTPIADVVGAELAGVIKIAKAITDGIQTGLGMGMDEFSAFVGEITGGTISERTKTASAADKASDEIYQKIAKAYDPESAELVHSLLTKTSELADIAGVESFEQLQEKVATFIADVKADNEAFEKVAGAIIGDLKFAGKDLNELIAETSYVSGRATDMNKVASELSDVDKIAELLAVSGQSDIFALQHSIRKNISDAVEKKASLATAGYSAKEIEAMMKYWF